MNTKLLWLLSIVLIALVGMRYNVSILAWVMFVPLLLLARKTNGFKGWFSLFLLLQVAYFLSLTKIVTDPMPYIMALGFSAPMAVGNFVILWISEKVRQKVGELLGIFFFASLMSVSEWLTFYTSELGSWGAMTYTQLGDLAFLQMSSLFGITLGSFFIYLSSAFIASFITYQDKKLLFKPALLMLGIYVLFYSYGVVRLENPQTSKTIRVAGIASDLQITPKGIPEKSYLDKGTQTLIKNTLQAISFGAKLVAWNEGATIIMKEDEEAFIEQMKAISLKESVDLVIAYIVPIDGIKKYENKYLYIQKGEILDEYFKYHPVPGEPAIKGTKISKIHNMNGIKISGAICYDFDFPTLGRELSQKGTDIAVVPSSDWQGIDYIHGQMAMVRSIEGGYALLRPVRGSTSYAFDAYGRVRASMSYFEENDRIMMASIPTKRVQTLYSKVGDIFPMMLLLFLGFVGFRFIKTSRLAALKGTMSTFLYAIKKSSDYENFYATCPYCGFNNIFNRVTDLKTTNLISFQQVQCLDNKCNKQFNINGDTVTPAYESIIYDCYNLFEHKKYTNCILNTAQAYEVFFSSFLSANLVFRPYENNKNKYYARELNHIIHNLRSAIEKFTYFKMRNIFFNVVINNIQPKDFNEAEDFINNIGVYTSEPSKTKFDTITDPAIKELLLKIKASEVSTLRNNVVHKVAYRPTAIEAETSFRETSEILNKASQIFGIRKYLYPQR